MGEDLERPERALAAEDEHTAAEDIDTAKLVQRVQAGESEVFGEVYTRYFGRVYAYLSTVIEDRHEAENTAQDVFLKAFESLPSYAPREGVPFRHWLFRIARNQARNALRDLSRVQVEDPAMIDRRRELAGEQEPEQEFELGLITDVDLVVLMRQLPQTQRQVLVMRYVLDLPFAEIGTATNRSADAARKLHERAIKFLRTRLEVLSGRTRGTTEQPLRDQPRMRKAFRQARVVRRRKFVLTDPY